LEGHIAGADLDSAHARVAILLFLLLGLGLPSEGLLQRAPDLRPQQVRGVEAQLRGQLREDSRGGGRRGREEAERQHNAQGTHGVTLEEKAEAPERREDAAQDGPGNT
jgi:hypothetical protein